MAVFADRVKALGEVIERANRYLAAGADLAFITGVATLDEVRHLKAMVNGPISIAAGLPTNLKTLPLCDLVALEIGRVSLPVVPLMAAINGMAQVLADVREQGDAWASTTAAGLGQFQSLMAR